MRSVQVVMEWAAELGASSASVSVPVSAAPWPLLAAALTVRGRAWLRCASGCG